MSHMDAAIQVANLIQAGLSNDEIRRVLGWPDFITGTPNPSDYQLDRDRAELAKPPMDDYDRDAHNVRRSITSPRR